MFMLVARDIMLSLFLSVCHICYFPTFVFYCLVQDMSPSVSYSCEHWNSMKCIFTVVGQQSLCIITCITLALAEHNNVNYFSLLWLMTMSNLLVVGDDVTAGIALGGWSASMPWLRKASRRRCTGSTPNPIAGPSRFNPLTRSCCQFELGGQSSPAAHCFFLVSCETTIDAAVSSLRRYHLFGCSLLCYWSRACVGRWYLNCQQILNHYISRFE